jgi:hypothetical protein
VRAGRSPGSGGLVVSRARSDVAGLSRRGDLFGESLSRLAFLLRQDKSFVVVARVDLST